ncbi:hypothetical protein R3W88_020339 [Solanum pinnatisectum]|uniref:F-box associated beta-propeller type 1 domain-containing protein n=1 Tax=Solanum pinnatisectum TaxID=50273 RepID=A0AAV9KR82_9SOLN|nr:hypothetical protein R3W88_020339 [Solanum pinnatisectum]
MIVIPLVIHWGLGLIRLLMTTKVVYVNGACHWITTKLEFTPARRNWRVIVVFNMHDETFSDMILPSSLINESQTHFDEIFLFVLDESLCLVDNNYDKREPIKIWMMKEYGAPDSWEKQFSIQNYHFAQNFPLRDDIFWTPYFGSAAPTELEIANDFMKPMAIRKNGEILWKDGQIIVLEMLVRSHPINGRENPKDGKRRISRAKSKYRMRSASLSYMSGLRKKERKSMQVKKPSLSN